MKHEKSNSEKLADEEWNLIFQDKIEVHIFLLTHIYVTSKI